VRAEAVRTPSSPLEALKDRIDTIYRARCADLPVTVVELPIVFRIGLIVAVLGGSDEQVANCMRDACEVARSGTPA